MKSRYCCLMKFSLLQLFYVFPELLSHFSLYIMCKILSIFKLSHNFDLSFNLFKFLILIFIFSQIFVQNTLAARNFIIQNVTTGNYIFVVNGTTGYVGIGLVNPLYPLHIIGDIYWSGTLQGGTVPWIRLSGYNLNVPWTGLLGWGNLTGFNLNVAWTGTLGGGNITAGTISTTQLADNSVTTAKIADNNVTLAKINQTSCGTNQALRSIGGGTYACVDITPGGLGVIGSGTVGYIAMWNGTNSINNSIIYQSGGNVGIGTTNPIDTLHVVNKVAGDGGPGGILIDRPDSTNYEAPLMWATAGSKKWWLGLNNEGTDKLYLYTFAGAGTVQTWDTNGNVGIGTTSPVRKLDVVGDINATGALYSVNGYYVGTNQIITSGRVLQNIASISQSLLPTTDNSYDRWRNANFAGSINTNNLVVSGSVNSNLVPGSDNTYNIGSSSNRWANVYAVNVYASNINGGTPITGSGSVGQVAFFTGPNTITGNDNLYWDNTNARLGIGTKLPQQKLDVVGNVNVTNNLYVSGNVGIGTTAPVSALTIRGFSGGTGGDPLAGYTRNLVIGGQQY